MNVSVNIPVNNKTIIDNKTINTYEQLDLSNKKVEKKALVLSSGGLDSTTVLAYVMKQGWKIVSLSFDYGQRHKIELKNGEKIANFFNIPRKVLKIDLTQIGGSALTDDIPVPENRELDEMLNIPSTFVPGRNMVFLSLAASYAYVNKINDIFIGVNALDYSGYPDCRPEFVGSMEKTINKALLRNVRIHAPLIDMSKKEIVKLGVSLNAPYFLTRSCYEGREKACGKCDSCLLRLKGFMKAGYIDPVEYESYPKWYEEYLKHKSTP